MTIKSTKRYKELQKRINQLRKHFVKGFESRNITDFSNRQMDLVRAFRVLCHAEIEAYFEGMAMELLLNAKRKWDIYHKANITIACLFAHYQKIETNASTSTKIYQVINKFERDRIEQNNGIKEQNLVKLFVPLGIDKDDIDATWLATIDSYGSGRGTVAHTSASTQQPIDINTEIQTVGFILQGIQQLEMKIIQILKAK